MKENLSVLIALAKYETGLARIREICPQAEVRVTKWLTDSGQTLPAEQMKGVQALFCEMPPENFDDFDKLKWIQLTSAGYSQVFDLPVLERGIRVCNGRGNFDVPIAEWNIMMMLMWHRLMLEQLENQNKRIFDRAARFHGEVRGLTAGFYGYGGIARETARLAKAMGLTVWTLEPGGKLPSRELMYRVEGTGDPEGILPDRVFDTGQIAEFMGSLDYLFITLPLTPTTEGIIGEKHLRMLKPSAVLINPARAKIIEEQAFIRCLKENWIRGSSVDAHYAYPLPPEHPLWSLPNIIMTPHISGSDASPHFLRRTYDIFTQNLERFCTGQPLLNELTEAQLRGL